MKIIVCLLISLCTFAVEVKTEIIFERPIEQVSEIICDSISYKLPWGTTSVSAKRKITNNSLKYEIYTTKPNYRNRFYMSCNTIVVKN